MNNNSLSICIPTYNRSKLAQCLDAVIPAAKKYNWPVYVQDNCESGDFDTRPYNYEKLYYSRNSHNIGADLNMFRVLRKAGSKYALWLGDDDIIDSDKASLINDYLSKSPDLVILSGASDEAKNFSQVKYFYLHYEP